MQCAFAPAVTSQARRSSSGNAGVITLLRHDLALVACRHTHLSAMRSQARERFPGNRQAPRPPGQGGGLSRYLGNPPLDLACDVSFHIACAPPGAAATVCNATYRRRSRPRSCAAGSPCQRAHASRPLARSGSWLHSSRATLTGVVRRRGGATETRQAAPPETQGLGLACLFMSIQGLGLASPPHLRHLRLKHRSRRLPRSSLAARLLAWLLALLKCSEDAGAHAARCGEGRANLETGHRCQAVHAAAAVHSLPLIGRETLTLGLNFRFGQAKYGVFRRTYARDWRLLPSGCCLYSDQ